MSRNWLRAWSVEVGGININPELRIRFTAELSTLQAPSVLELIVSNLSKETASELGKTPKWTPISLSAGYQDNLGLIYVGGIQKVLANIRENPTDTAVAFYASGNIKAFARGHVNTTLKAGSTGMDAFQALLKTLSKFGVTQGNIPTDALKKIQFPRAHVMYGDTRYHLRKLAQDVNAQFHFGNDHRLHITPADSKVGQGSPIEINSATGMVGLPMEQTLGIIVRFLINPNVQINGLVKINQADIQDAPPIILNEGADVKRIFPPRTADGVYIVRGITWEGDSRGNYWYGTAILNHPEVLQPDAAKIGLGGVTPSAGGGGGAAP